MVWKADDVSVENLTVCNFLGRHGRVGQRDLVERRRRVGQDRPARLLGQLPDRDPHVLRQREPPAARVRHLLQQLGRAGTWNQLYASNLNDSGTYVGACQQLCDVVMNHAWMEYNALGYSGTNSGGTVVIENSQFDNNQDGLDTNTQIGGDPPAPQDGPCPNGGTSPITHTHSCWVFIHNYVHNNNNPNVPRRPAARPAGPVGTGMTVSGGRNDTVMDNTFANNGAWGILFVPYPRQRHAQPAPDLHRRRRPRGAGLRLRLRPRGRRLAGQHVQPQRLLRQPEQRRLRPDHAVRRRAAELLRAATPPPTAAPRPTWRRPSRRAASPPRPATPGARCSPRCSATPAWAAARREPITRGRTARSALKRAAHRAADHAEPVRGRAGQPVVPKPGGRMLRPVPDPDLVRSPSGKRSSISRPRSARARDTAVTRGAHDDPGAVGPEQVVGELDRPAVGVRRRAG